MRSEALLCLAIALAACGRSPSPGFYVLSSRDGAAAPGQPLQVELRRPSIPSYLERPNIVRRITPERLELAADERWGGNLEEMLGATLAADLAQRLPSGLVYTEASSIASAPDVRVELALSRFELNEAGNVTLVAEVATRWAGLAGPPVVARYELSARPNGSGTAEVVAALSDLVGRLSDAMAETLRAGPPAPPSRLPTGSGVRMGLAR